MATFARSFSVVVRARAGAIRRLTLMKWYPGYTQQQFPTDQKFTKDFLKAYGYDSPGIQSRAKEVLELSGDLSAKIDHPWDKAKTFYDWVWQSIRGRIQSFTSVSQAIKDRAGDCEERAAVFVALCRNVGIPARLVWVPNHNWAEFYLLDHEGKGHWIPVHTACYSWFGWTGAHELVLQKGDKITIPEKRREQRLMEDWLQWMGRKPKVRYFGELTPLPNEGESDPGPGARSKDEKGEWVLLGKHALDKKLRDGPRTFGHPGYRFVPGQP